MNKIGLIALGGASLFFAQTAFADTVAPMAVTPRVMAADEQPLAPMALNSLSNPPADIATARVVDEKGMTIGAVQKVDIDGGKPSKVEVALIGSDRIIALDAGQLSYDKSNNVLTAALDKSQLAAMPRS